MKNGQLTTARGGDLVEFKPNETAEALAKADAVIDYAKRLKDWPLLMRAVDTKVEEQREFVDWWREKVTIRHGAGRGKKSVERGAFSCDAAEELTKITHQQVSKWNKRLAREDEYRAAIYGAAYRKAMADDHNHRAQGTGENEWYTPPEHIERVRRLFGEIDVDPASSPIAQKIVRAGQFFSAEDDGLGQEWRGRVWLNPPYAQPAIQQFVEKMVTEVASGRTTEAVMLTHNYTDTEWFHIAAKACNAICFTRGRIAFLSPTGEKAAPTQGQAFFYYGARTAEFTAAFSSVGFVR